MGYITTFPDFGPRVDSFRFNGGEIAIAKHLNPHLAIIGSATAVFGTIFDVKQFSGTVGTKINFLTGRFRPYATAQIGFAYQHSNGMYAGDHHPPLKPNTVDVEDGLTYRGGLGADLQLSTGVYLRLIQWDVQPQPWARHTPFYNNFSSGIGYRF